MNRKTLYYILGLVTLIVVLGVVYFFIFRSDTTLTEEGVETPVIGTEDIRLRLTPEEERAGVTLEEKASNVQASQNTARENFEDVNEVTVRKVVDVPMLSPTLSADRQKILYYDESLGEFFQADLDGTSPEQITSAGFSNLKDVKWSKSKDSAILYFAGNAGGDARLIAFDFTDQSFNDLGDNVVEAAFSPDGEQIVYLFVDEERDVSNISIANADGSNWKIVQPLRQNTVLLNWTNPFRFLISDQPNGYSPSSFYSLSTSGENLSPILSDSYGVTYNVAPNGQNMVYTASSPRSSELFLYASDIEGGDSRDLEVSTIADKCAYGADSIVLYCGVPLQGNLDFVLPDDYYDGRFITNDAFFRIDTQTGEKLRLGGPDEFNFVYDVFDPFVSESGKTMYFVRKQDKRLYALISP